MKYFRIILPLLILGFALASTIAPATADAAMYNCTVMCSADGSPGTDPCADPQPQTVITSDPMSTPGSCTDYLRPNWCGSYCVDIVEPTCADQGQLGTYPNCYNPPPPPQPTCADQGQLGTYPYCYNPPPPPPPPTCADQGQLGTYPNCYNPPPPPPQPTCADQGQLGTYPYCYNPPPPPTCADYGMLGNYPYCYNPPPPPPPPTCADYGQQGSYPNCYNPPPPPTCADYGQQGSYPNCYTPTCQELGNCPVPPPTCADYGQQGTYPYCSNPPTCADYGQLGTYPYCYAYPTCADYGQSGTYPNCYSACVGDMGQGCYSGANTCGETNYGSINCDGSCSAGTPSDASCYPSQSASCYPTSSSESTGATVTWIANTSGFGGSPTISWSNPYGTPSSASGQSTSFSTSYASAGQYAPTINVSDWTGSASASCSPVTIASNTCPVAVDLTLTATPPRVRTGQSSTITYSFSNVPSSTTCTLTENGTMIASRTPSSCDLSSTAVSRTINTQTTYVLTCGAKTEQAIVNVLPNMVEF